MGGARQVLVFLCVLVLGVSALRGLRARARRIASRVGMVATDKDSSASTEADAEMDYTGGGLNNNNLGGVEISMPQVHIAPDQNQVGDSGNEFNSDSSMGGNAKVKNLKKAPGQDLPEVLKSWNELQGLSEREMLANDDPSFKRSQEALGLAYRR